MHSHCCSECKKSFVCTQPPESILCDKYCLSCKQDKKSQNAEQLRIWDESIKNSYDDSKSKERFKAINQALKIYFNSENWLELRRKANPGLK